MGLGYGEAKVPEKWDVEPGISRGTRALLDVVHSGKAGYGARTGCVTEIQQLCCTRHL